MFFQMLIEHPLLYVQLIVIVVFSICLHELAHGIAALSQGDETPRQEGHITLNPFVHLGWESIIFLCIAGMAWGSMPVNPANFRSRRWSDVLVSAAGPLCNLALGFVLIALLEIASSAPLFSTSVKRFSILFFYLAAQTNLTLCFLNVLPIPPLDGFHILSKLFPDLERINNSNYGLFLLMLLMVSGLGTSLYAVSDLIIKTTSGIDLPFL
jgi:Zn-dependent protease